MRGLRLSPLIVRVPLSDSATDLVPLKACLEEIIDLKEDQVTFIRLCAMCAAEIEALGVPMPAYDSQDVVIVS